jgi:hypothetical protein
MTKPLRHALTIISANRSRDSWFAGSIVISQFIKRFPNDIDIHHVDFAAFSDAVGKDCSSLVSAGFFIKAQKSFGSELEVAFSGVAGDFSLNWVLVLERPSKIVTDSRLGVRASISDVLAEKIEMCSDTANSKHKDDLLTIFEQVDSVAAEIRREVAC